jgi:hypothetical protein
VTCESDFSYYLIFFFVSFTIKNSLNKKWVFIKVGRTTLVLNYHIPKSGEEYFVFVLSVLYSKRVLYL